MKKFSIDLDDASEDFFGALERAADTSRSHQAIITAESKVEAANALAFRLVPFLMEQLDTYTEDED